ncbi:trypsin-like [Haliotis rubra]|uniref:trypsin-like n=1 Tax=Haliotis rubra TaxID=36100 RepID=UPI001EE5CD21|nr:trypsin-like [Haliotis rubra]
MALLLGFILGSLFTGTAMDLDPQGCGTNSVGFDYSTLTKTNNKRIVGGNIVTPHSFPWMVALKYRGVFQCGGSLLKGSSNKWYILTGAHCLHGAVVSDLEVVLGAHDLSKNEASSETIAIKQTMNHPSFNPITLEYDTGLMELAVPPQIQRPEINFGCVAANKPSSGTICYVIGWGTTSVESAPSDMLQVVDKPIMSQQTCEGIYGTDFRNSSMLCAGYPQGGKDSCKLDSGGPLMCYHNSRMEIIGTVSWGFGCAEPNSPAVYSSTVSARQWIDKTINA